MGGGYASGFVMPDGTIKSVRLAVCRNMIQLGDDGTRVGLMYAALILQPAFAGRDAGLV